MSRYYICTNYSYDVYMCAHIQHTHTDTHTQQLGFHIDSLFYGLEPKPDTQCKVLNSWQE